MLFRILYKQTAATECRGNESFVIYVLVTSACGQYPAGSSHCVTARAAVRERKLGSRD